jgi:hypothetical protein
MFSAENDANLRSSVVAAWSILTLWERVHGVMRSF